MFNVRKCPKCGGNVPEGNEVCNNCGNKMRFFSRSGVIVGGSKNANTIPGGNPFESKKKNNGGCVLVIFLLLFFGLPIVSIFFEAFFEFSEMDYVDIDRTETDTCDSLCFPHDYNEFDNYCLCSDGDIYDKNGNLEYEGTNYESFNNNAKCSIYCNENYVRYENDMCCCSNGKKYNISGEQLSDILYDDENITDVNVSNWYKDVTFGKTVVTVLCETDNYECTRYKPLIEDLANKENLLLYYFNVDTLNDYDKNILIKTYTFSSNRELYFVPYTFVVKNNVFIDGAISSYSTSTIESILRRNEIID